MPFVLLSKSFHLMFSWEPIWKFMKSDTTAAKFAGCMNTLNIHSRASPK